ncbi:hypothetical protein V8B97DRAFT_1918289 [Scleroderma yunnanense]
MSSREPLWFCHECHAEMRVLMMDDPSDDPRNFQHNALDDFDYPHFPGHMDNVLRGLRSTWDSQRDFAPPSPPPVPSRTPDGGMGGGGFRFEVHTGPGRSSRTVILGGSNTLGRSSNQTESGVPTMSEFLRRNDDGHISGTVLAQYLLTLLASNPNARRGGPFSEIFGQGGRWGDYVFNEEALDQIMTQLMENSTAGRPVPATEDILLKLPRDVLTEGSPLLGKDCAVCKEQFTLYPEDDGELIVVTLPCNHPFHQDCILPWLKSSGTCPVCRYQLVAQPQPPGGPGEDSPPTRPPPRSQSSNNSRRSGGGSGSGTNFQSLFSSGSSSGGNGGSSSGSGYSPLHRRSLDNSRNSPYFPGHWMDGID